MNPEQIDKVFSKSANEVELEAATNASFDAWTMSARNLFKNARKLTEDLDDHSTMIMTDIFGQGVAREHSRRLQEHVRHEEEAGHWQAANHYRRRDLNFSRSTLGEFDDYTKRLNTSLYGVDSDSFKTYQQVMALRAPVKFNQLLNKILQSN